MIIDIILDIGPKQSRSIHKKYRQQYDYINTQKNFVQIIKTVSSLYLFAENAKKTLIHHCIVHGITK